LGKGFAVGDQQLPGSILGVNPDGSITVLVPPSPSSGMTNPMTGPGDLIEGGTGGTPQRLPPGLFGQFLEMVAGVPTWQGNFQNGFAVTGGQANFESVAVAHSGGNWFWINDNVGETFWQLPDGITEFARFDSSGVIHFRAASTLSLQGPIKDKAGTLGAVSNVLVNDGTGKVSWGTVGGMTNPMTTTGDIIYSADNVGTPARLGIGTPGQVLTVSGGLPSWQASGGGGGSSSMLEQVMDYIAANPTFPIDTLLTSGAYIAFVFFLNDNTAGWVDATNAVHTVAGGKTLYPIFTWQAVLQDTASRQGRLRNTTDGTDVIALGTFQVNGAEGGFGLALGPIDGATNVWPNAVAGKVVKAGLWNVNAATRTRGIIVICKEV